MTRYEVRANDNPETMPLGTSTISSYATAADAEQAIRLELREWRKSPYFTEGGYLPRLIVEVGPDAERAVIAPDPVDIQCIRCGKWESLAANDTVERHTINGETWCSRCSAHHHLPQLGGVA